MVRNVARPDRAVYSFFLSKNGLIRLVWSPAPENLDHFLDEICQLRF
jgi:hypothetical protein